MKSTAEILARIDQLTQNTSRSLAQLSSRRSFIGKIGSVLVGASLLPLLPVARAATGEARGVNELGDDQSCEYWRYCALGGTLCTCCGGSVNQCPPGAEPSPISWVGTCRNPVDGKDYLISY
ncbi:MAG: methylamine dehydrogenase light chain, partial [Limisphaerales bacterium]